MQWNDNDQAYILLIFDSLMQCHKTMKMIQARSVLESIPIVCAIAFTEGRFRLSVHHSNRNTDKLQDIIDSVVIVNSCS